MPSLEQPLQAALRGPRPSQAACGQLLAAADVLSGGALLLSELHLSGEVATALVVGGSLLVAAGTPLLSQLVSRSQVLLLLPGQASSAAPGITGLLNAAAVLAGAVLPLGREAPHTAARRALLKGAFAPRRILPFLAAMLAAVQAAAADPSGELRTGTAAIACLLLGWPRYRHAATALPAVCHIISLVTAPGLLPSQMLPAPTLLRCGCSSTCWKAKSVPNSRQLFWPTALWLSGCSCC